MGARTMSYRRRWRFFAFSLLLALYVMSSGVFCAAQQSTPPSPPSEPPAKSEPARAFFGCVSNSGGGFVLTFSLEDGRARTYLLTGDTELVPQYVGSEVRITGVPTHYEDKDTVDVQSIELLHQPVMRKPILGSTWRTYKDKDYGVRIDYPSNYEPSDEELPDGLSANFANPSAVVRVFAAQLSRGAYPNTTFAGSTLAIFVGQGVTNEPACRAFANSDVDAMSAPIIGGVKYSQGGYDGGGMGTAYSYYFFNAYRNGFCYEIAFLTAVGSRAFYYFDFCKIDMVDQDALRNALLPYVSFFKPIKKPAATKSKRHSHPEIKSFEIAPVLTGLASTMPGKTVRVDWSVTGADYVQLRIECPKDSKISVSTFPGSYLNCYDRQQNLEELTFPLDDALTLNFTNSSDVADSATLSLVLQPFFKGVADPRRSRTLTLAVSSRPWAVDVSR
jgi:hypothetical protein